MANRTIIGLLLAASFFMTATTPSVSAEVIAPNVALAPEEVVLTQLRALQKNDDPEPDAGIKQTFALAHPDNQRVTGPVERFAMMIRSPAYSPLLNHRAHQVDLLEEADAYVRFNVFVETPSGKAYQYLWEVRPLKDGPNQGAWLTTIVSRPMEAGQSL